MDFNFVFKAGFILFCLFVIYRTGWLLAKPANLLVGDVVCVLIGLIMFFFGDNSLASTAISGIIGFTGLALAWQDLNNMLFERVSEQHRRQYEEIIAATKAGSSSKRSVGFGQLQAAQRARCAKR